MRRSCIQMEQMKYRIETLLRLLFWWSSIQSCKTSDISQSFRNRKTTWFYIIMVTGFKSQERFVWSYAIFSVLCYIKLMYRTSIIELHHSLLFLSQSLLKASSWDVSIYPWHKMFRVVSFQLCWLSRQNVKSR